jgi:membrane protein insertase Oxa1/YidC/SpoIIIJ
MILLPLLVAGSTWLQQKLTTAGQPTSTDPQAAQMQQSMSVTMPLMFGFFAMQMPSGLSIYFIVSNLIGMAIQWATNRWLKNDDEPARRQAAQPRTPRQDTRKKPSTKEPAKGRGYKKS